MTQPQREALLDLLLLSTFVDSHLSLKEDEALQAAIEAIGWEAEKPRDIFVLTGINRARAAADTDEATAKFIDARAGLFADTASRLAALEAIKGVLSNDGVADSETSFLKLVEKALA